MRILFIFTLFFLTIYSYELQFFSNSTEALKIVEKYLPTNPNIIEAGAYIGTDSVRMAKKWPEGHIYSFEPVPKLYEILLDHTKEYANIHTFEFAIGNSIGKAKMHVSELCDKPGTPFASSSLLAPKKHLYLDRSIHFPKVLDVDVTTFDNFLEENEISHIDFLWLDMQGFELNALKASPKILKSVKVILTEIEFSEAYENQYLFKDIKHWLEEQGFQMIGFNKECRWYGDAIFIKK